MSSKRALIAFAILSLLVARPAAARALTAIPSHDVKVSIIPPPDAPGQLARAQAYLDGPTLLLRGGWTHPDDLENVPEPRSPVPELVAPVRVIIPGAYKFIDLESKVNVLGELEAETYTPEARIYRIYLPITGMHDEHRFEVVFHAGLKVPFRIATDFAPSEALVIRSRDCVRQGIALDAAVESFQERTEPNLMFVFCRTDSDVVHVGVYAPLDRKWVKYGYGARKVFRDRGLYFDLPRPPRGVLVPETVTEFALEDAHGKSLRYELRFDPPYRPRLFTASLGLGPAWNHYDESQRGITIDELSFFGKFWTQVKTPLSGLDAYADIYGTIQDITHSPDTQPPVNKPLPALNYWAINTRVGYVEPVTPIEPEWSFMTGWYWWRFEIVGDNYGLANKLSGPQAFVQYKHQGLHETPWWATASWVFLADRGLPGSIQNYEFRLGGGFDIAWVGKRRPLSLNGDFSRLQYYQGDRNMTLHNVVLYLSYPIY